MSLAHAADLAWASSTAPGAGGAGAFAQVGLFAAMFAIFYFLLIRPQQKQKKDKAAMLAAMKRGDRVVTSGGIHGTIRNLGEHVLTLRIADQVTVEVDRAHIARVVPEGSSAPDA